MYKFEYPVFIWVYMQGLSEKVFFLKSATVQAKHLAK